MSINSPAKQERIERHLMRQRGAGVRAVSANFGFSFGSSAPPSSDATPAPEGPPAKRRKTALHNVVNALGLDHGVERQNQTNSSLQASKATKPRRRLALQDDDNGWSSRTHALDVEDSFVAGLEAKTKARRQRKKATVSTDLEVPACETVSEPVVKGRPKRRAAAAAVAASKVPDVVLEAHIPVEQKGRVAIVKKDETSQTRRKEKHAEDPVASPGRDSLLAQHVVAQHAKVRTKRGTRKEKAETSTSDTHGFAQPPMDRPSERTAESRGLAPKPVKSTRQKRKRAGSVLDRQASREANESGHDLREQPPDVPPAESDVLLSDTVAPAKKVRKKHRKETILTDTLCLGPTSGLQRRALMEVDANSPIRSASPGKPSANSKPALATREKHQGKSLPSHDKTSARRKKPVRPDSDKPQATVKETIERIQASNGPDWVPSLHADKTVIRKENDRNLPRDRRRLDKADKAPAIVSTKMSASTKDEDVDWLFEPLKTASPSKLAPKHTTTISRSLKSRSKMPDIDLDDLLTDIASFAKPDSGSGALLLQDTTRLASKPKKKR